MTLTDHFPNCPCDSCCALHGPVGGLAKSAEEKADEMMLELAREILNEQLIRLTNYETTTKIRR